MGYLEVRNQVLNAVRTAIAAHRAAGRRPRVITTGHSLGGAIAVHAGLDLARQFRATPVHTYTFGAPRTGSMTFSIFANATIRELYHVVNFRDPVSFTPPLGPKTGPHGLRYDRMAETWYINSRGTLRPNIPYGTVALNFNNHMPQAYIDALNPPVVRFNTTPRSTRMR